MEGGNGWWTSPVVGFCGEKGALSLRSNFQNPRKTLEKNHQNPSNLRYFTNFLIGIWRVWLCRHGRQLVSGLPVLQVQMLPGDLVGCGLGRRSKNVSFPFSGEVLKNWLVFSSERTWEDKDGEILKHFLGKDGESLRD